MSKRDDTLQQDGPILTEAVIIALLNAMNILREKVELKPVLLDDFFDTINVEVEKLNSYPWFYHD